MTENTDNQLANLNSDAPKKNPQDDFFGYAGFAKVIASSIQRTPSPEGLVMAIHGPWGAGKSSLLNFVKYYLQQEADDSQVVAIDFNPWWFNDKEQLAKQFLSLFSAKFENKFLRDIGDKIAAYADSLGTTVAIGYGIPWLDGSIAYVLKKLGRTKQEVSSAKKEISQALRKGKKRYLFVIDDIDRLTPEEIRELFKVIKALADFPNVIYLLSFDREVVEKALNITLGVDGNAYLEKIVQVPFSLPSIDRTRLQSKFIADVSHVISQFQVPEFDQTYWGNMFHGGLVHFLRKPRDIVRIVNTISVTYPAIAGEVNLVDYIGLEFLRVFEPTVYRLICENKGMFAGATLNRSSEDIDRFRMFHEAWIAKVDENNRSATKEIISQLFPRAAYVWTRMGYEDIWLSKWRKSLRVCSPDFFEIYFQFGISQDLLSRAEFKNLIESANSQNAVLEILRSATDVTRSDGHSKAGDFVDRLSDPEEEFTADATRVFLAAIFEIGDQLLTSGDMNNEVFSIPNRWKMDWLVDNLFSRIDLEHRTELLHTLVSTGNAISLIASTIDKIQYYIENSQENHGSALGQLDLPNLFESLRLILVNRLKQIPIEEMLAWKELAFVLHLWCKWGGANEAKQGVMTLINSPDKLSQLLERYGTYGSVYGIGDHVARRTSDINFDFLKEVVDIDSLEPRVHELLAATSLTDLQRSAANSFVKKRIQDALNLAATT